MSEENTGQALVNKHITAKKKLGSPFVSVMLVVLLAGVTISVVLGVVYIGTKSPSQKVVIQASVCSTEGVVMKLNSNLSDITNNGDQSKAKEAIDYIKKQSNYSADPTCVEALARFYYINRDSVNFASQINELEKLADSGKYPSNRFDGVTSIASKSVDFESLTGRSR